MHRYSGAHNRPIYRMLSGTTLRCGFTIGGDRHSSLKQRCYSSGWCRGLRIKKLDALPRLVIHFQETAYVHVVHNVRADPNLRITQGACGNLRQVVILEFN